jgi:DNA mismatch endonuclease, patch repair protein
VADRISSEHRSWNMSQIKGKNTAPERIIRSFLHRAGFRFSLHAKLPGKPDIVLPKYRVVVLVHGCFWHRHKGCRLAYHPKSNLGFWSEKFRQNIARDEVVKKSLRRLGWRVYTVWECQIERDAQRAATRIIKRLPNSRTIRVLGQRRARK